MPRHKGILIGCPEYHVLVRGTYECDENGRYLLDSKGAFLLAMVRCTHHGGRCAQTLCVLHRYNNRGPGSWFPDRVLAAPQRSTRPGRPRPCVRPGDGTALCAEA